MICAIIAPMNIGPINRNDADGFKDDETEAFHEMHDSRMQLNAKVSCLGYALLLVGAAVGAILFYFFG